MSENNEKITLYELLSVLGLSLTLVPIFFGVLLATEDGKPIKAVLLTIAVAIGFIVAVVAAIKAKRADENPYLWRKVEIGALVVYAVVAFFVAKPFLSFFSFYTNETEIKEIAIADIDGIRTLCKKYDVETDNSLALAKETIINYYENGTRRCNSIDSIVPNVEGVEYWHINKSEAVQTGNEIYSEINNIARKTDTWNYLQLLPLAKEIETASNSIVERLQEKVASVGIPVVVKNGGTYIVSGYVQYADLNMPQVTTKFPYEMQNLRERNFVLGVVFYVIFNLLVLACYFFSERSKFGYDNNAPVGGKYL